MYKITISTPAGDHVFPCTEDEWKNIQFWMTSKDPIFIHTLSDSARIFILREHVISILQEK